MRAVMTEKQGLSSLMSPAYEQESTDKTGNQDKSSVRLVCVMYSTIMHAQTDSTPPPPPHNPGFSLLSQCSLTVLWSVSQGFS